MPFATGQGAGIIVDIYTLTSFLNSIEIAADISAHDSTVFGQNSETHQTGIKAGGLQLGGFFERTAASGSHAVLSAALGAATPKIATVTPEGFTIGYPASLAYANETRYDDSLKIDSLTSVAAYLKATGGVDFGHILHAANSEASSSNSASVDNAAATANGGVAHIHYQASVAGGGSAVVKIQHSANNSTWADLVTFTTLVSAVYGAQRVEVAAGTTVNRYLRVLWTLTGSGVEFTFPVAFARR